MLIRFNAHFGFSFFCKMTTIHNENNLLVLLHDCRYFIFGLQRFISIGNVLQNYIMTSASCSCLLLTHQLGCKCLMVVLNERTSKEFTRFTMTDDQYRN